METKKKLENFNSIACKLGNLDACYLVHRRGYKTFATFNGKDYTFYIAKGKKDLGETPRFYYAYEASTGLRVCGLGSDTVEAACSQLFSDSFVRAFTKLIESGELIKLQDRFQLTLKMEGEQNENTRIKDKS